MSSVTFDPSGVYKGSHLSSTASPAPATPAPSSTAPGPNALHPYAASNNNGTAHPSGTAQVPLGNSSLRLGAVPPVGKRLHGPRSLTSNMATSALKLATAHCQKPSKVPAAAPASALDMGPR